MIDYEIICIEILQTHGPLLGSELQEFLVGEAKVTRNNARQIVHRLKNEKKLRTTDPVRFQRNQVLYFLPRQNIKYKLKEVLPNQAKTIDRLFHALADQDGILHWTEFKKISGGVSNREQEPNLRHKTVNAIFDEMRHLGLVRDIVSYNKSKFVVAHEDWIPTSGQHETRSEQRLRDLSFNRQFTRDLLGWLERMNIAGWNSTHVTEEDGDGSLNGFYWDAIGFSYLWGLYKTTKSNNLFDPSEEKTGSLIVIESVLHRTMKIYDLAGFISRVDVLYGRLKTKDNFRIIPILFVQSIDEESLSLARRKGIMVVSILEVFGTRIADALQAVRVLDPRNVDAEALADILAAADESGQDGKFGNLKGYAFNLMMASIFSNQGFTTTKLGMKYSAQGRKCECDVVIPVDDDFLIVCETKGYNEGIQVHLGDTDKEPDTVKKFIEGTCRIVELETGKKVLPMFITSGEFSDDALDYLQQKNKTKKIQSLLSRRNFPRNIFMDRKDLFDFFGNQQMYTEHKKVLKEYFRDHKKEKGRKNEKG